MDQTISNSHTPPPLCLCDFLFNGHIDLVKYHLYSKKIYNDEGYIDPIEDVFKKENR